MNFIIFCVSVVVVLAGVVAAIIKVTEYVLTKTTMKPMMQAAMDGDMDLVAQLLAAGEDVNVKTALGDTSLIFAASHGHVEIVRLLIDKGADVNAQGAGKQTALTHALERDDTEIAKLLIERGVDQNVASSNGAPLEIAARKGNLEVAKLLLARGVTATPAALIACVADPPRNASIDVLDSRTGIAQLLVEMGVNVNMAPQNGDTALHYAAATRNAPMVKLLIEHGANVNAPGNAGQPPLIRALVSRDQAVIELLTKAGAKRS